MINFILYLWQLPQHLFALIFRLIQRNNIVEVSRKKLTPPYDTVDTIIYKLKNFNSGISLGKYIFISIRYTNNHFILLHEKGHSIQSKYFGWLYLIIIGIPSAIHKVWFSYKSKKNPLDYYDFWTEKWSNSLMKIKKEDLEQKKV